MQILEIKGKKWMVGIEWEILPGDSTIKKEAKEVAQKTNSKFGVVVDYDSTYAIGLTKKISKEPSAALYLAIANQVNLEENTNNDYPDWVVLEELGDEKYWMGVVKSGIPAPQFDAILSVTEVKERITELLINDTYSIYSSSGEIISIFEGIKTIEKKSLVELTEEVKTKIKFEKLLGIPNYVFYAGAGVAVVALISYAALQFVNGLTLKEKAQNIALKEQRDREAAQAKYNQELKEYKDLKEKSQREEQSKITAALSGNPSKILTAFYDNVGSIDGGTNGWKLTLIECYYDVIHAGSSDINVNSGDYPKLACDYLYERTALSTTRMLLEDYPTAKLNGDKAVVTRKVNIDPIYIAKADDSILETLKSSKD
jgi:Pilin accessory protein (PilO)